MILCQCSVKQRLKANKIIFFYQNLCLFFGYGQNLPPDFLTTGQFIELGPKNYCVFEKSKEGSLPSNWTRISYDASERKERVG